MYLELDNDFNIDYTFRGFMIQARRVADDSPVGYFMNNSMNDSMEYQPQCDDDVCKSLAVSYCYILIECTILLQTAATHTDSNDKEDVLLEWVAPPAGAGAIRFRCCICTCVNSYVLPIISTCVTSRCIYDVTMIGIL